jgi:hypothetical protein
MTGERDSMPKKGSRNIVIKAPTKHKMDKEELAQHLNEMRRGARVYKNKKHLTEKFSRRKFILRIIKKIKNVQIIVKKVVTLTDKWTVSVSTFYGELTVFTFASKTFFQPFFPFGTNPVLFREKLNFFLVRN